MPQHRTSPQDRRRFPRVAKAVQLRIDVLQEDRGQGRPAESVDVSVGGVCAQLGKRLPEGTQVLVTFVGMPADHDLQVRGRIAWCEYNRTRRAHEAGVELLELSDEEIERLLLLVTEQSWSAKAPPDHRRIHLSKHLVVEYRQRGGWLGGGWKTASTEEVSLREAVLKAEKMLPRSTKLQMRLLLPDHEPGPLSCDAVVTDHQPARRPSEWDHVVVFEGISQEDRSRLAGFLSHEILK